MASSEKAAHKMKDSTRKSADKSGHSRAVQARDGVVLLIGLFVTAILPCQALAAETMRALYFGNSLTAGTAPEFHARLAAGAGDEWIAQMFAIGGGRLAQHVDRMFPPEGKSADEKGTAARESLEKGDWDVVVIQPHQEHLFAKPNWVKPPREMGDIAMGTQLIEWIRRHQPQARIYLYQTWATPPYEDGNQENPRFDQFDYERFWLRPYANPAPADDPHPSRIMRTRDFHRQLLEALNETCAKVLNDRPLRVIPTGDVMLELHRRLKAGTFTDAAGKPFVLERRTVIVNNEKEKKFADLHSERVPFTSLSLFYQDFQHQNPGLPRYFDAAVFYAVLFGKKPSGLDYAKYNIFPSKRGDGSFDMTSSYSWQPNDNRTFIAITPEVADALADVIWEVVSTHPQTGLAKAGTGRSGAVIPAERKAPTGAMQPVDFTAFLDAHCLECHDRDVKEGGLDLSAFTDETAVMKDRATWRAVYEKIESHQMPPPKQNDLPTEAERREIMAWIMDIASRLDPALGAPDPGKPALRRLTRLEYNNAIRDLFELKMDIFAFSERLTTLCWMILLSSPAAFPGPIHSLPSQERKHRQECLCRGLAALSSARFVVR
jgi:hypothetical protein